MLKILHTADWHVGRSFGQFEPEVSQKLARDRVSVIERILGLADQYAVDAVLCAGDLFDSPNPGEQWWQAVADIFSRRKRWTRPVVLLPGNHDPITPESVYHPRHPFRRALPDWVHVVDREDFQLELPHNAVVCAAPCTSTAGDRDLALSLPSRTDGDHRIRIGLVHGSTFDIAGHATNFPISTDAPRSRGLDYLAIGDTHSFREISDNAVAPIIYPSTPEPTSFRESDSGYVALVSFKRHGARPIVRRERVARWTWREVTVRSLAELQALATEDLQSTVVKLSLDLSVTAREANQVDRVLLTLRGTEATNARAGALLCDRSKLRVHIAADSDAFASCLPKAVLETAALLQQESGSLEVSQQAVAQRAIIILKRLLEEVQ